MDVTVVYSTDGLNKRFGLVTLEDDLHFFPEYNGAYLLRADLYEDFPELEEHNMRLIFIQSRGGYMRCEDTCRDFITKSIPDQIL